MIAWWFQCTAITAALGELSPQLNCSRVRQAQTVHAVTERYKDVTVPMLGGVPVIGVRMLYIRFTSCCLLAGAVASCSAAAAPSNPPVIGQIVSRDVAISIGGPPSIHVKDSIDEECGVIFLVRPSTLVFRRTHDGRTASASLSDLTVGRRVGVWSDGVLESCPGQASAKAVEVLE